MRKSIYREPYRMMVSTLRSARMRAGLTQADAGQKIGHSRQWVSKAEICEIRLDVMQVIAFCRAYGLKAHSLVRRMEEESEEEPSSYLSGVCRAAFLPASFHQLGDVRINFRKDQSCCPPHFHRGRGVP